jgi:hypothetical protein
MPSMNYWTIIGPRIERSRNYYVVPCICICGEKRFVGEQNILQGKSRSCGCQKRNIGHPTHGDGGTHFHEIWMAMRNRVNCKTAGNYKWYGGKGITIDPKWDKYLNFKKDMYTSYMQHLEKYGRRETTLERKDNNGPYTKANCEWATRQEQGRHKG